ncbi:alpha/beta hydrolase-fold protein [Halonatronum saccharophilum]|uniref:alpha/beta hydrolase-fold protein n=1 Tax=Halonatronum saccharophilum TaxID=150060 RepID=UPI000480C512|nr:alpha/beta hydrolase-fold protein [Halonatronum saccharophilum]
MRKILVFILSLVVMLTVVGCKDDDKLNGGQNGQVVNESIDLLKEFRNFKEEVKKLRGVQGKEELIDDIIDKMGEGSFPLVQGEDVIFFYRGDVGEEVYLLSDLSNWQKINMNNLDNTSLYYVQLKIDPKSSFEYKFWVDGEFKADSLNSLKVANYQFEESNQVVMEKYDLKGYWVEREGVERGSIKDISIEDMNIQLYLPFDYNKDENYSAIYFLGNEYLSYGKAVNTLDNLIYSKEVDGVIAIFIPYNHLLSYNDKERIDILKGLVPYISDTYNAIKDQIIVSNSNLASLGARASLEGEGLIDKVVLQSPIVDRNLLTLIEKGDNKGLEFYIDWGIFNWDSNFNNTLDLLHKLEAFDYSYTFRKHYSGNGWANWREGLSYALDYTLNDLDDSFEKSIIIEEDFKRDYPRYLDDVDNYSFSGKRGEESYIIKFNKSSIMGLDNFNFKSFSLELDFSFINQGPFALILKGEDIYTLHFSKEELTLLKGKGDLIYQGEFDSNEELINLEWKVEGEKLALYVQEERLVDVAYSTLTSNYLSFFGDEGTKVSLSRFKVEERLD